LPALSALFKISAAQLGGLLLGGGDSLAEEGRGAAAGFAFNESRNTIGGRARMRTLRDRFPAPALSCLSGLKCGAQTLQRAGGGIEYGAALFLFERAQMKKAREPVVRRHWLDLGRKRG
jgi:hypothetical protein